MSFTFTKTDSLGDLPQEIKDYLPQVIENRIEEFNQMQSAFNSGDMGEIRNYCHKIEGVAGSYHLFKLDEIIRYIHELAYKANHKEILNTVPILGEYLQEIQKHI